MSKCDCTQRRERHKVDILVVVFVKDGLFEREELGSLRKEFEIVDLRVVDDLYGVVYEDRRDEGCNREEPRVVHVVGARCEEPLRVEDYHGTAVGKGGLRVNPAPYTVGLGVDLGPYLEAVPARLVKKLVHQKALSTVKCANNADNNNYIWKKM